jgi:class 3 adenylate cyclase
MWHDHDAKLKGSAVRLWHLVDERTRPGADTARIDRRIWDLFGEEWSVMFTDLAGFSRNVAAFGIIHFLQVIHEQKRVLLPVVGDHDGILIKVEADSLLVIFKRAASALRCAVEMQHASARYNEERAPEERLLLCVGVGHGLILRIGDDDVYGKEVNAASKLGEDTAKAGEVLVTGATRAAAGDLAGLTFTPFDVVVPGSDENFRLIY